MPIWIIIAVLAAAAAILAPFAIKYVNVLIAKLHIDALSAEQPVIDNLIESGIKYVFQTFTQQLKEKSPDGKLTPDQAKEAMGKAITMIRDHAEAVGIDKFKDVIADDKRLSELIEAKLPGVKDKVGDWGK